MTHLDFGSLRFNSFTNVYNVDWNIPGYLNRTIEKDLRAGGNFTFIPIAVNLSEDWKQTMSKNILYAVTEREPDDLKAFLNQTAGPEPPGQCAGFYEKRGHLFLLKQFKICASFSSNGRARGGSNDAPA